MDGCADAEVWAFTRDPSLGLDFRAHEDSKFIFLVGKGLSFSLRRSYFRQLKSCFGKSIFTKNSYFFSENKIISLWENEDLLGKMEFSK